MRIDVAPGPRMGMAVIVGVVVALASGCASWESAVRISVPERYSYENRLQNTRWYLDCMTGQDLGAGRPRGRVLLAADALLREEGAATLAGRATPAFAMWLPDRSKVVLQGAWFEALPTVVEIEIRRGQDESLLWSGALEIHNLAENYSAVSGLGAPGPGMMYSWEEELDAVEDLAVVEAIEQAASGEIEVRLIRTGDGVEPLIAPIQLMPEAGMG